MSTHCTYHVNASMLAIERPAPKFNTSLEEQGVRTELHCSIPGCHVVAVEYNSERVDIRRCSRCRKRLTHEDSVDHSECNACRYKKDRKRRR
jgi:hypothetical protein